MKKNEKKIFLFDIWEQIKEKVKTVYIVKRWGIDDAHIITDPTDVVEWSDIEEVFDMMAKRIEDESKANEDKTSKENISD